MSYSKFLVVATICYSVIARIHAYAIRCCQQRVRILAFDSADRTFSQPMAQFGHSSSSGRTLFVGVRIYDGLFTVSAFQCVFRGRGHSYAARDKRQG